MSTNPRYAGIPPKLIAEMMELQAREKARSKFEVAQRRSFAANDSVYQGINPIQMSTREGANSTRNTPSMAGNELRYPDGKVVKL